jgi:AcrR family transcriptional regulator
VRTVDPEKHRQRRLQIIDAAVGLFATKGLAGTTTAEICRAAGVSTGNLFHYFPSKQAIFHAMLELDHDTWSTVLDEAAADPNPWAALMRVVDRLAAQATHPRMAGLLVEVVAQAHRDPRSASLLAEGDQQVMRGVATLIERLECAGHAEPGLRPETAARWVLTITDGLMGRGYPEPDRDPATDVATAKELITRLLRYTGSSSTAPASASSSPDVPARTSERSGSDAGHR